MRRFESTNSFRLPKGARPPRVLTPFWLQLFSSFIFILALIGGTFAWLWPDVQRRIFILPRAFLTMSAVETAAQYLPLQRLYAIDSDVEARRRNPFLYQLQRVASAQQVGVRLGPGARDAVQEARGEDPGRALRLDASPGGDFQDFILEFHLAVPVNGEWTYWLSTKPAQVGEPVPFANYLEAYAFQGPGWDNFLDSDGLFRIYLESDEKEIARLAAARREMSPPPRDGINGLRDPLISARSVGERVDPLEAARMLAATGADLSRAVLIAEFPQERTLGATFILRIVFVGILLLAALVALAAAIVLTWRINLPIRRLARAMTEISTGNHRFRVGQPYAGNELGRLAWLFDAMMDEYEASRELTEGVALASRIQMDLIPSPPGRIRDVEIAAWYQPSSDVGGDFYDFVAKGDLLYIVVSDAVGHGIDSGLIMASARAMTRTLLEYESSPGHLLTRLNKLLARDFRDGNFMTMVVAMLDLSKNELTICSAGHEPVLMTSGPLKTCRMIKAGHPPLGLFPELTYHDPEPIVLKTDDVVVFSSDGIRECHDPAEEQFGMKRFSELVCASSGSAEALVAAVQEALGRHAAERGIDDDISLVVLRAAGRAPEPCPKT